jgi:hypothetical protein
VLVDKSSRPTPSQAQFPRYESAAVGTDRKLSHRANDSLSTVLATMRRHSSVTRGGKASLARHGCGGEHSLSFMWAFAAATVEVATVEEVGCGAAPRRSRAAKAQYVAPPCASLPGLKPNPPSSRENDRESKRVLQRSKHSATKYQTHLRKSGSGIRKRQRLEHRWHPTAPAERMMLQRRR